MSKHFGVMTKRAWTERRHSVRVESPFRSNVLARELCLVWCVVRCSVRACRLRTSAECEEFEGVIDRVERATLLAGVRPLGVGELVNWQC